MPTKHPSTNNSNRCDRANCVDSHDNLVGHRSVIFHVDLEHGGNNCGVLQLSVVACNPTEGKIVGEFDKHVKPPATAIWSNHAMEHIPTMKESHLLWKSQKSGCDLFGSSKGILPMGQKRESLLPGVANPAITSGCFVSLKTRIMECHLCLGGARVSWTPKRLFLAAPVAN
jgi:hypothetical protein